MSISFPMSESNDGASSPCKSSTLEISPLSSSRSRSRSAASCSCSGDSSVCCCASSSACGVGVPSSLKVFRLKIGAGASDGSSPAARCSASSVRISLRWPVRSSTVPTSSSPPDDHAVLNSTHCKPRVRMSICSRSQSSFACVALRRCCTVASAGGSSFFSCALSWLTVRTPRSCHRSKKLMPYAHSVRRFFSCCSDDDLTFALA
mmetsp:Transcript_15186/g.33966  ORF Transcript_15186/g.33966 Transcript_15186/m.33966 type:complete len:205 (+) Transcript_15186:498-1112(+)